jgi:hypothetical protein
MGQMAIGYAVHLHMNMSVGLSEDLPLEDLNHYPHAYEDY